MANMTPAVIEHLRRTLPMLLDPQHDHSKHNNVECINALCDQALRACAVSATPASDALELAERWKDVHSDESHGAAGKNLGILARALLAAAPQQGQADIEVLATYEAKPGDDGITLKRQWHTGGAWLQKGQCIAVLDGMPRVEAERKGDIDYEQRWKNVVASLPVASGPKGRWKYCLFYNGYWYVKKSHAERQIDSTLEEAAKVCEKRAAVRWDSKGYTEPSTNASYYPGRAAEVNTAMDEEDEDCAAAIRALKRLDMKPEQGES